MSFLLSDSFATILAQAADAAAPAAAAGEQPAPNPLFTFLPMILLFLGFWFLFIRPQQKRQKEIQQKQSQLKMGDKVETSSGIIGKVVGIDDTTVTLQVGEGVRIPFRRAHVVGFLSDSESK